MAVYRDTPEGKRMQVLVLSKHEVNRRHLKGILEGLGFSEQEFLDAL